MATKKFCDVCEKEIVIGFKLVIEQSDGNGFMDYKRDLCSDCGYEIKKEIKKSKKQHKQKAQEEKLKNDK